MRNNFKTAASPASLPTPRQRGLWLLRQSPESLADEAMMIDVVKQGADLSLTDDRKRSALSWACHWERTDLVREMLKHPLDLNLQDSLGDTPLMLATRNGSLDIAEFLIKAGAGINLPGQRGKTPLMVAIEQMDSDITRDLLNAGADVNAVDGFRNTALIYALYNSTLLENLIARGADITHRNNDGLTVTEIGRKRKLSGSLAVLEKEEARLAVIERQKLEEKRHVETQLSKGLPLDAPLEILQPVRAKPKRPHA